MKSQILNLLTIARKAGKVELGYDPTESALYSGRCRLVLVMADASDRTKKNAKFLCEKYKCPIIETDCTKEDILEKLGKSSGVLAICDAGFAKGFIKRTQKQDK